MSIQVSDHLQECFKKLQARFGNKEFTTDDIGPYDFIRAEYVCRKLRDAGLLSWRVKMDKEFNTQGIYKIKKTKIQ